MNIYKIATSLLLVAVLSLGLTKTLVAGQLSLADCIDIAVNNNPKIDVALQQYNQSLGVLTQAKSGYLPRLSVGASGGRTNIKDLRPVDEDNVFRANLSASQLIYDFGRTIGGIDASRSNREAARANLLQQLHDVSFEVKRAYYVVLENQALVKVALQTVDNYEAHLYRVKKFYEAGIRTRIDITNSELELANAKIVLLRARSDLKTSRVDLEEILGLKPEGGNYSLAPAFDAIDQIASRTEPLAYTLDELLVTAPEKRPGLTELSQLIFAAEASLKQARGDFWPVIDAQGSYDSYETDISSLSDQWTVAALINWEIFSGFATEGKVAEAKGLLREVTAARHQLELSVINDVTDSFFRAEENRDAVDLADLAVKLATENLELAEGRYKAGLADVIEYNDAQLNFSSSQSDLISTYFGYLTSIARMERAAGINPGLSEDIVAGLIDKDEEGE